MEVDILDNYFDPIMNGTATMHVLHKFQWEDSTGEHDAESCQSLLPPNNNPSGSPAVFRACSGHNFTH